MRNFAQLLFAPFLLNKQAQVTPSYDYIIIGGGTAGLTIAARLTENPHISVLVLEAGNDHSNDTNVLAPGLYSGMFGDPTYDWDYKTVSQVHANNQIIGHPRGKQLGGSSAINLLFWTHASRQDLNNWGALGNYHWSWDAVNPYFSKSESYVAPSTVVAQDLETQYVRPASHGKEGPIKNTFPDIYGPFTTAWPKTYDTLGLGVKSDPRDGLALGGYTNLLNMDLKTHRRSYAATAYYLPAKIRPKLTVLTGTLVEKIIFTKNKKGIIPVVNGVLYATNDGKVQVKANKEVILCAGSIGSPQILELSGIGSPILLKKLGIDVVVGNSNVGENLQDHAYVPIGYEVIPGIPTYENFSDPAYTEAAFAAYLTNATGPFATAGASSGLLSCAQIGCTNLIPPSFPASLAPGLREQYDLLTKHFATEAIAQEIGVGGGLSPQFSSDASKLFSTKLPGNFFSLLGVLTHPFSRGSSHILSADPKIYPAFDPNYFSHPFDLEVMSAIALHLQVVAKTKPLSSLLKGNGTVYQSDYYKLDAANVKAWIKANMQTEFHPCGTVAMLPKEKGGVVDARFRVYGVEGLRVVDASVFPMIPRANLQTLVYAISERAADFAKADAGL